MELKRTAIIAIAAVLALAVAWTAGRYTAPAKIVTKEVTVEKRVEVVSQTAINEAVAKAQAEWQKNEKVRTVTKTVYKEGKIVEKIVYKDRDTSESSSSSSSTSSTSVENTTKVNTVEVVKWKEKIVEAKKDRFRIGAGAVVSLDQLQLKPTYEVHGGVRVVGGLWAGATYTPEHKLIDVTLSLQF